MCNNKIIHWNLLKSEKKSGFGEKIALPSKMPYCFKSILVFFSSPCQRQCELLPSLVVCR